ncbi:DNA polymerase IV [Proteiniclasticum sp. C24MP]|uniref:Y-family DNA polymerase n=1 Tax=Proteiniclasticum sp. C24MP TaxID=3374101 RepID=UPI003754936E
MENIIFHVDVNSAYLSWNATWDLQHGKTLDLRTVPSIVGGDPESRHGIVLAKSIPSKKYGIKTGETLFSALMKCPELKIVPPRYSIYLKASDAMVEILREYSPLIERYSIDECFMDMRHLTKENAVETAVALKNRIRGELGFTVNIGISTGKLLAKMASDFKKPDQVHTLYQEEVQKKMWPLPVQEMFMVGSRTTEKLKKMNIHTIGDLAKTDPQFLHAKFKKYGYMISCYARGIDSSTVKNEGTVEMKGMGNSTTLPFDFTDRISCHNVLLSIGETLVPRLRASRKLVKTVSIHIRSSDFTSFSMQKTLPFASDSTSLLMAAACELFDEIWNEEPVRHLGISFSQLKEKDIQQLSFFKDSRAEKMNRMDQVIDMVRKNFGDDSIIRATFINSPVKAFSGGVVEKDYIFMNSHL